MALWTSVAVSPGFCVQIARSDKGICRASLSTNVEEFAATFGNANRHDEDRLLENAARQLGAYFAGTLRSFELPLDLRGTPFQQRVWSALLAIPYGAIRTYAAIATEIGAPKAVRAVGAANGRNPVPIIVPCHRVIQTGGGLGGYTGGLHFKRLLLAIEGRKDVYERSGKRANGAPDAAEAASG